MECHTHRACFPRSFQVDRNSSKNCWAEGKAPTIEDVVILFRPAGPEEIELVKASGFRRWPARLPDQPIFYPVTNEEYATQIAKEWNIPASGSSYVTRFQVKASFMNQYPIQKVGSAIHTEWWIPAEDLEDLNDNIVGLIEIIREFHAKE